jgi:hypothetical protein
VPNGLTRDEAEYLAGLVKAARDKAVLAKAQVTSRNATMTLGFEIAMCDAIAAKLTEARTA